MYSIIGYGECTSHREKTTASWDRQRKALMGRIESGESLTYMHVINCAPYVDPPRLVTDIAGEMDALTETFRDCKTCLKACTAAVDMLAVSTYILITVLKSPSSYNLLHASV